MNPILYRQLALDYCCSPEDAADGRNHFSVYRPLEGRRLFQAGEDCYLKVAVVNGKLLFTGQEEILRWCEEQEIEVFRGDKRFDEAFVFDPQAPDRLGLAAILDGEILSMAGASSDCARMWQIGVNTEPAARGLGLGTALVCRLKDELLRRGILPFYGTSPSHLASQRLALRAGFRPAWLELVTSR